MSFYSLLPTAEQTFLTSFHFSSQQDVLKTYVCLCVCVCACVASGVYTFSGHSALSLFHPRCFMWSAVALQTWPAPCGKAWIALVVLAHLCSAHSCLVHNRVAVSSYETFSHHPPTIHWFITFAGTSVQPELIFFLNLKDTSILYVYE